MTFIDNSEECKRRIEEGLIAGLYEAAEEVHAQTTRNTPVDTGQLKGSWRWIVDEGELKATIGSPLENAIWTEFGTGEWAAEGNGRKGGWKYKDKKGKWHFTRGKRPLYPLFNAFTTLQRVIPEIISDAVERYTR